MENRIMIFLPLIQRHKFFYKQIKDNLENKSIKTYFVTYSQENYSYWEKILGNNVFLIYLDKNDNNDIDVVNFHSRNIHKLGLTCELSIIYKVQNKQAPFRIFSHPVILETKSRINSTLKFIETKSITGAFGYSALDLDNYSFNISCADKDLDIFYMDYSPIDNYEITFKKSYYWDFIRNNANSVKKENLHSNDPNRQLLELRKSRKFIFGRLYDSITFAYTSNEISLYKYFLNTIYKFLFLKNFNLFYIKLFKVSEVSDKSILFIGSCDNESYYIESGYDSTYIRHIIDFSKNVNNKIYFKPHPAAVDEKLLILDYLKLKINGINIVMGDIDFSKYEKVVGVSSSILIKALLKGSNVYSLIHGVHNLFGVQKIDSINDLLKRNLKDTKYIHNNEYIFKGNQRYYSKNQAKQVADSLTSLIVNYEK